ncbi:MAG: ATP-binding protein, partial [Lachnospira sp.]|nr:ATP-binding protein [Lachnospira sp.]
LKQDVSEFEGIALKQERNFVADITEKPVYAEVEIEQMREVFDNILMNSIKYSRKNTDIIVTLLEENDNILIKVSNMTDCIKKSDCERIFDKFYRADHARNSSISGNGLGLSIVKETVEGLGGSVLADYDNGLFTISIKLKKCNQNQDQEIR